MSDDSMSDPAPNSSPTPGLDQETLRPRMERFARIRSAHRALPNAATEMDAVDSRETLADNVRTSLQALAKGVLGGDGDESPAISFPTLEEVDHALESMEKDLLERVDGVGFAELRTTIPKAAELRRKEVVALTDSILGDQEGLLGRLAKLEYLITVLSIQEEDGERKIVHDPATLTPTLARITAEIPETDETEAVAVELYQAACPDGEADNLAWHLQQSRDRKGMLGLTCLSPSVLRAVVTYNTRVFNLFASALDSSRESDALLDQILGDHAYASEPASQPFDDFDFDPHALETDDEEVESVFESEGIAVLLEALQRRLKGIPIGSCTSERVALSLDVSRLDPVETEAICAAAPSSEQQILKYTAVVGLLVRDIGVVQSQLLEIGVSEALLCDQWVRELDQVLGKLVSEGIADPERFAAATQLSGIKTKHLLAPMSALRAKSAGSKGRPARTEPDESGAELGRLARTASQAQETQEPASRLTGNDPSWLHARRNQLATLSIPVVILLAIFGVNLLMAEPSTIDTLSTRDLARHSAYLTSAYRSKQGKGRGFVIGRVDRDFAKLDASRRVAVANEMVERLRADGMREAMLFDSAGKLQVHFASGKLRLPTP